VAFFRARQNKSGISQVHTEITLEQIIKNPDWSELSPTLPVVAEMLYHHLDYAGHRVEIPAGLLAWFFWAIGKEYYLYWRDTEQPVRIESKTMRLQLSPKLSDDGLSFDILLGSPGKSPFSILGQEVYFYGQVPIWVCWKNGFYPVQTGLPAPARLGHRAVAAVYSHGRRFGVPGSGLDPICPWPTSMARRNSWSRCSRFRGGPV